MWCFQLTTLKESNRRSSGNKIIVIYTCEISYFYNLETMLNEISIHPLTASWISDTGTFKPIIPYFKPKFSLMQEYCCQHNRYALEQFSESIVGSISDYFLSLLSLNILQSVSDSRRFRVHSMLLNFIVQITSKYLPFVCWIYYDFFFASAKMTVVEDLKA